MLWAKRTLMGLALNSVGIIPVLFIVLIIALARTELALASVWQVVPWTVIPAFAGSWFFVLMVTERLLPWVRGVLAGLVGFVAFGAAWMVYPYGFGFDPFIHQAAASYLVEQGTISLPSPLYLGYYGLLALLRTLTPFSIGALDRALVPLGMTAFFCWWVIRGIDVWKLPRWCGWGMLLIPFSFATFSVPYHLTVVLLLLLIACLPRLSWHWWMIPALGCFALIHPLLLVPAAVLIGGVCFWKHGTWKKDGVMAVTTCLGIVGLFWVYSLQGGGAFTLPTAQSMVHAFRVVTGFPYGGEALSPWMEYAWRIQHVWVFVATFLGAYGLLRLTPEDLRPVARVPVFVALGMAVALLLVAAGTSFKNILPSEQYEFALRLRNVLPWMVFPGLGYVLVALANRLTRGVVGLMGAALVSILWYTAYPLFVPNSTLASYGLGSAEILAYEQAEKMSGSQSYAALAPQMVSAAALRGFGFHRELTTEAGSRYPYAIPTGGELYALYTRLWSNEAGDTLLQEACAFARVPQVFVIVPVGWDSGLFIDRKLRDITNVEMPVDQRHRVYRYACDSSNR